MKYNALFPKLLLVGVFSHSHRKEQNATPPSSAPPVTGLSGEGFPSREKEKEEGGGETERSVWSSHPGPHPHSACSSRPAVPVGSMVVGRKSMEQ